jgi:hypothetical protein
VTHFSAKLLIAAVVSFTAVACMHNASAPSSPEAGLENVNPPDMFTTTEYGSAAVAEYAFVSPDRETEETETARHLPPPTTVTRMVTGSQLHSSGGTSLALK